MIVAGFVLLALLWILLLLVAGGLCLWGWLRSRRGRGLEDTLTRSLVALASGVLASPIVAGLLVRRTPLDDLALAWAFGFVGVALGVFVLLHPLAFRVRRDAT